MLPPVAALLPQATTAFQVVLSTQPPGDAKVQERMVPGAHGAGVGAAHALEPASLTVPAAQSTHETAFATSLNVPAAQATHEAASGEPAAQHSLQRESENALVPASVAQRL